MSFQKQWLGATGLTVALSVLLSLSFTGSVGAAPTARSSNEPVLVRVWDRLERLWTLATTGFEPNGGVPAESDEVEGASEPADQPPTSAPQIGSEIDPNG